MSERKRSHHALIKPMLSFGDHNGLMRGESAEPVTTARLPSWAALACCGAAAVLAGLLFGDARAAMEHPRQRVSQRDQAFNPTALTIQRGTTLEIVNDDGDVLHHAYVESPTLKFDSGDQEPGETAPITFNVAGSFVVLCGIHPRMKLKVRVE